jgi:uncharacterized phage-like protein YoqJ
MFTGHRQIDVGDAMALPGALDLLLEKLIADGYTDFRCGGAQGFDTIAALKVLEKKKKYPNVKLHLFLPCKDQADAWSERAKAVYRAVIDMADSVRYLCESYNPGCMHARNRAMVDGSDLCVAYCTSSRGGTAYTVEYARKKNVDSIIIDKKYLKEMSK